MTPSVYDVLMGDAVLADVVRPTGEQGLWLAPANYGLAGAQVDSGPVLPSKLADRRGRYSVPGSCRPSTGSITVLTEPFGHSHITGNPPMPVVNTEAAGEGGENGRNSILKCGEAGANPDRCGRGLCGRRV